MFVGYLSISMWWSSEHFARETFGDVQYKLGCKNYSSEDFFLEERDHIWLFTFMNLLAHWNLWPDFY